MTTERIAEAVTGGAPRPRRKMRSTLCPRRAGDAVPERGTSVERWVDDEHVAPGLPRPDPLRAPGPKYQPDAVIEGASGGAGAGGLAPPM